MSQINEIYIALGANKDERLLYLEKARFYLKKISLGQWQESSIYETKAIGPGNQKDYLNQVVRFNSNLAPTKLLCFCKGIEIRLGRKKTIFWGEREIDVDLLYIDNEKYSSKSLKIPHPRIEERLFVLAPLAEINENKIDPSNGKSIKEMLENIKTDKNECRLLDLKESIRK